MTTTYQWQSNDALSKYAPVSTKVFMGYKNVATPGWGELEDSMTAFGKSLVKRGDLLTPLESVNLKNGGTLKIVTYVPLENAAGRVTYRAMPEGITERDISGSPNSLIRSLGVVRAYEVVFNRLQVGSQIKDFVRGKLLPAASRSRARSNAEMLLSNYFEDGAPLDQQKPEYQKLILERAQAAAAQEADTFDQRFLPAFKAYLSQAMGDQTAPAALRQRYKTSRFIFGGGPETQESSMQTILNAATSPEVAAVNPNVFSRRGDGTEADPVMDMVAAAFCRVIQAPDSPEPVRYLDDLQPGQYNASVEQMVREGLPPFYPHLNFAEAPENYGITGFRLTQRRSLLYVARGLCSNVDIARSFGTKMALAEVYSAGGKGVQEMIVSAVYPYTQTARLDDYSRTRHVNYTFTQAHTNYVCPARGFVALIFLMDYLNTDRQLRRHTVKYLSWIKSECERAATMGRASLFSSGAIPATYATFALSPTKRVALTGAGTNVFRFLPGASQEVEMIDSGVDIRTGIPAGTGYTSIGMGSDPATASDTKTDAEIAPDPAKDEPAPDIGTSEQEAGGTEAAGGIDSKWIYIGSAAVLTAAIGTAFFVMNKRKSQNII